MPFLRIFAAAAGLALAMTIVAVGISVANRSLAHEAAERQHFINQSIMWREITVRLANSLAAAAARDNDARIKKLLAAHGIAPRPPIGARTAPPATAAAPK